MGLARNEYYSVASPASVGEGHCDSEEQVAGHCAAEWPQAAGGWKLVLRRRGLIADPAAGSGLDRDVRTRTVTPDVTAHGHLSGVGTGACVGNGRMVKLTRELPMFGPPGG
jgi:hypothetical protein